MFFSFHPYLGKIPILANAFQIWEVLVNNGVKLPTFDQLTSGDLLYLGDYIT